MRPLAAAALLLAAAAPLTAWAAVLPRHVDPSLVGERGPGPLQLLAFYSHVAQKILSLDLNASLSEISRAHKIYAPPGLRAALSRLNDLLERYLESMNGAREAADLAEQMIGLGSPDQARKALEEARKALTISRIVYEDLSRALDQVSGLVPGGEVAGLKAQLEKPLRDLEERLRRLDESVKILRGVVRTSIEVRVNSTAVVYGDYVRVWGVLEGEGRGALAGREVVVRFGPREARAVTGASGIFETVFRADLYQEVVKIYAEFIPGEAGYAYSRSEEILVRILYRIPPLRAQLDRGSAAPGEPVALTVYGEEGLRIEISDPFRGKALLEARGGPVVYTTAVPHDASEGVYIFGVRSLPSGPVGPAEVSLNLSVARLSPQILLEAPAFVLTGIPASILVSSSAAGALDVRVPGGVSYTVAEGVVIVLVPHSYLSPSLRISVLLSPSAPSYRPVEASVEVPVYNTPATLASAALVGALLAASAARISRRGRAPLAEEGPAAEAREARQGVAGEGVLRSLFRRLVAILEALAGIPYRASYTLREYSEAVSSRLSQGLAGLLRLFFRKLEALIYGEPSLDERARERALEALLRALIRRLGGEEGP